MSLPNCACPQLGVVTFTGHPDMQQASKQERERKKSGPTSRRCNGYEKQRRKNVLYLSCLCKNWKIDKEQGRGKKETYFKVKEITQYVSLKSFDGNYIFKPIYSLFSFHERKLKVNIRNQQITFECSLDWLLINQGYWLSCNS